VQERNSGGVAIGDYDGDGLPDLLFSRLHGGPALYRNHGNGTFGDVTAAAGLLLPAAGDDDASCQPLGSARLTSGSVSTAGAYFVDVDNDGDEDIFLTTVGGCRHALFINNGAGHFADETVARGAGVVAAGDRSRVAGTSVAVGDYDGDGYLDLFVAEWRLFFNRDLGGARGAGVVVGGGGGGGGGVGGGGGDSSHDASPPPLGGARMSNSRLLRNRGSDGLPGHFEDVTDSAGVRLERRTSELLRRRWLSRKRMTVSAGVFSFSPHFEDLDRDGNVDLLIVGDFATTVLFWGRGDGTFREDEGPTAAAAAAAGGLGLGADENGMGLAVGDVDGDGFADLFVSAIYRAGGARADVPFGTAGNFFYRNMGSGPGRGFAWANWTAATGTQDAGWGWGAALADLDNDGDLDVFVANGYEIPETTYDDEWNVRASRLWVNPGSVFGGAAGGGGVTAAAVGRDPGTHRTATWADAAAEAGVACTKMGRGVAVGDLNGDGRLDIVVANFAETPSVYVAAGGGAGGRYLRVDVREGPGLRASLGARVRVDAWSSCELNVDATSVPASTSTVIVSQTVTVGSRTGFQGQSEATAHFGLGQTGCGRVNVTVTWPAARSGDGETVHVADGVEVDGTLLVLRRGGGDGAEGEGAPTSRRAPGANHNREAWARVLAAGETVSAAAKENSVGATASAPASAPAPTQLPPLPAALDSILWHELLQPLDPVDPFPLDRPPGDPGRADAPLRRCAPPAYEDGVSEPAGARRKSARHISNVLMSSSSSSSSAAAARAEGAKEGEARSDAAAAAIVSDLHVHFGQFLSHDVGHTVAEANSLPSSFFPIPVPAGDPVFDPKGTGTAVLRLRRSVFNASAVPRAQVNKMTAYLDGSVIYGTALGRLAELREFAGGRLHETEGGGMPLNAKGMPNDNPLARPVGSLRLAGDPRVNIQPGLHAVHALWVREHNRIARRLEALWAKGKEAGLMKGRSVYASSSWGGGKGAKKWEVQIQDLAGGLLDEFLFQKARNIVVAELQIVAFKEYLPVTLGYVPGVGVGGPASGGGVDDDDDDNPGVVLQGEEWPGWARMTSAKKQPPSPPPPPKPPATPARKGTVASSVGTGAEDTFPPPPLEARTKPTAAEYAAWRNASSAWARARIPLYTGHRPGLDAGMCNEVSTAAFRFGHSQAGDAFTLASEGGALLRAAAVDEDGRGGPSSSFAVVVVVPGGVTTGTGAAAHDLPSVRELALKDSYFLPGTAGMVDDLLRGMMMRPALPVDEVMEDHVRNLLFGRRENGGLDLAAINIQRGRDHGLASWAATRSALGLSPLPATVSGLGADEDLMVRLVEALGGEALEDVDLFVGGLVESGLQQRRVGRGEGGEGATGRRGAAAPATAPAALVGETFGVLLAEQFARARDADPFWYANGKIMTERAAAALEAITSLKGIVGRNVALGRGK
jgi:hypothetical protein